MPNEEAAFLEQLRAIFKTEAREHLDVLSQILGEMDRDKVYRTRPEILEQMYRESHSLKGAARSVNRDDIVMLCQGMEDLFSEIKLGHTRLTAQWCALLLEAVDLCYGIVDQRRKEKDPAIDDMIARLAGTEPACPAASKPCPGLQDQGAGPTQPSGAETVRIRTSRLDDLFQQAEEMIGLKTVLRQRVSDLKGLKAMFDQWKKKRAGKAVPEARAPGSGPENLPRDSFIAGFESRLMRLIRDMETDQKTSAMMIDKLLGDVKMTLMQPFASLLNTLPRQVRELSRSLGKAVELTIEGQDIEIDRRILEQIKAPLNHLVRNCIDHGIESPDERTKKNKPPRGRIHISVQSRDDKIQLELSDDGAGIDVSKVKDSAVQHHILDMASAENLTDPDALQLIFQSGITTSALITDISGRGLGLAIVREKLEQIHGSVHVESRPGKGTVFKLRMPLTLVTFQGVLIQVQGQGFIFPSLHVEQALRIARENIRTVENTATIIFKNRPIPLVSLKTALQMPPASMPGSMLDSNEKSAFINAVVLNFSGRIMAFVVDDVLGIEEVLVKPLGDQLGRVRNVLGATVQGNGKVVPILNVSDLMQSVVMSGSGFTDICENGDKKKKNILVVEDSITARTLLKNIFQSSGYDVTTAVNGLEGFNLLQHDRFDLVVSDVEMPEMNGFELTEKIRANEKTTDLPVILVTALASALDRERGMKAGASAYIVKSSLEQSSLLDIVERLI